MLVLEGVAPNVVACCRNYMNSHTHNDVKTIISRQSSEIHERRKVLFILIQCDVSLFVILVAACNGPDVF